MEALHEQITVPIGKTFKFISLITSCETFNPESDLLKNRYKEILSLSQDINIQISEND